MAQFDEFRVAGSKFKSPTWRLAAKRMPAHRFWRQYGTIAGMRELTAPHATSANRIEFDGTRAMRLDYLYLNSLCGPDPDLHR